MIPNSTNVDCFYGSGIIMFLLGVGKRWHELDGRFFRRVVDVKEPCLRVQESRVSEINSNYKLPVECHVA